LSAQERRDAAPRPAGPDLGTAASGLGERSLVLRLIVGFWTVHYIMLAARTMLLGAPMSHWQVDLRRLPPTLLAVVLSYGIYLALKRLGDRPFWQKLALAAALVGPSASLYSVTNDFIQFYLWPTQTFTPYSAHMFWTLVFPFIASFASCTALILALSYSFDVREKERRLAQIGIMTREAQLMALRYQLNPHFLFNTLNSISSMLWQSNIEQAEAMIVRLSDFLRRTLEIDPTSDVILAEEIELQRLYLAIEQIRFSDRLDARFAVDDEVSHARVPSLILQPLVENAVRYAVAPSPLVTLVNITARARGGRLILEVQDNGRGAPVAGGTGVGLANVAARLLTRFGADASLVSGPRPEGGYRVTLDLPLELVRR
jgi:two-component system LytT family sensor kinase